MNILFISMDLSGGDLCYRLQKEGHVVKLFIEEEEHRHNLDGMVEKITDWRAELDWIGKDGLIIFDSVGYGVQQTELRKAGFSVVGGSEMGDRLEYDRQYGQKIFSVCGIDIVPTTHFSNTQDAIDFVIREEGPWVIKQNGHTRKDFNYVGQFSNNRDIIDVLQGYEENAKDESDSIDLQKKIFGIEIGIGRYFNGKQWVGPIELNIEHKNLFNGDLGPNTFEMGTVMWYDDNEHNRLFQATLAKIESYLRHIDFHGDIDINVIVNQDEIYPLEATARFGYPALQLQMELHTSPWGEFLKAIADGQPYDLQYKKGFGVVILVAMPPFPYGESLRKHSSKGTKIMFQSDMTEEDMQHIHFEEVSKNVVNDEFIVSGDSGYVLHVGGVADTVEGAREKVYSVAKKIVIPKMFYRTDIGVKFMEKDYAQLKGWGWV